MEACVMGGEEEVLSRSCEPSGTGGIGPARLAGPTIRLHRDDDRPIRQTERLLDRLGKPRADLRLVRQPIDDDGDIVLHPAVELEVVGQADHLAVHAGADEATSGFGSWPRNWRA